MKTIYRSEEGKNRILELYDAQLSRLPMPWKDVYIETSFGSTHIVETGNFDGEPLLFFTEAMPQVLITSLTAAFFLRISIYTR